MKNIVTIILLSLTFYSCSKGGDERLKEQESIRSQEQINAQNENQREWAEKMEKDLNQRKHFIEAIEGSFTGEAAVGDIDFDIKARFTSSIPIAYSDRIRTLDEINYELSNLALNMNIKLENPRVSNSAASCIVENYRPDINKGIINIISESCKNTFKLMLADDFTISDFQTQERRAMQLAQSVRNNEIEQIDILSGLFESSVSTNEYEFKLKRD